MSRNLVIADRKFIHNFIAFYTYKYLIKTFLHCGFHPSPDLSPRILSALALRAPTDKSTRAEIRAWVKNTVQ